VLVVMADGDEQVGQVVVVETVVRAAPVAADADQALLAQQPELVGHGALLEVDGGDELLDGALALEQGPQELQAAGRAERAHRLGQQLGLVARQRPLRRGVLGRVGHGADATHEHVFMHARRIRAA
jgi:hypothetical protein